MFGEESDIPPLCSPGGAFVSAPAMKAELLSAGLTASSHETLWSCRRPVIVGVHSVVLPSERVRLSGTCCILIRMVVWTRLVASQCFFQRNDFVLAPKLSRLFRRLLRCGEFPLEWRIADVTPILKGPLSALVCNYRPISITPVLSKVFERLISLRFGRFFGEIWGPVISPVPILEEFGYL